EAHERESWTGEEWRAWKEERLAFLLHRAATQVPYYRDEWVRRRAAGDDAPWEDLANWPELDKEAVRRAPEDFVADDVDRRKLLEVVTSGTTGTPIRLWRSRTMDRSWYALFEAWKRRWYGIDRTSRWAIVGGRSVVPPDQRRPPFWVWNAGMHQLYLSGLHIGRETVAAYLDAMARHRVSHMIGYPSSLYAMAWMAADQGLVAPRLRVVVSNAEPLRPEHREAIARVFGCPVRDTYGMVETVAAANECEHGGMHLWPDVGVVEAVDDEGHAVPPGTPGALICTGLLNADMPLIRYRVGDRAVLGAPTGEPCACGRRLPVLERIEGRSIDNLVAPDGRRLFWWDPTVFAGIPTRERQVIQERVDKIDVVVVPAEGFDEASERLVVERMRRLLGDVEVTVRRADAIPRGPNGKFRSVVSHVAQR
ncbi:MAG: AMP-binding protein, partial [Trueperaceae bacterium]|nr:AMP-binding protein [Trueperaceae bacterium]